MIRGDVGGLEFAGGHWLDTAILALRQAQGEGDWWGDRELPWTIDLGGSAGIRRPVNTKTLTLSLSKGEDGNAERALAVMGTNPTAGIDRQAPTGVSPA